MRAYFFAHSYLSGIQKGLQAAHCLQEINYRAKHVPLWTKVLDEWARRHKTIIILNGGNSVELTDLADAMAAQPVTYKLPWGYFAEDDSMSYATTCVGVIVPDTIYDADKLNISNLSDVWLHSEIKSRQLAQ